MPSIDAISQSYASPSKATQLDNPSFTDKNLFLKMYVAQIANQDPLNPTSSDALTQQMSQFAMVQDIGDMKTGIDKLVDMLDIANSYNVFQSAKDTLGKTVEVKSSQDGQATATGVVTEVKRKDNGIFLVVNGQEYESKNVISIK